MGHNVTIFSHRQKSMMRGAQYMHRSIPGLELDPPVKLAYILYGDVDHYRQKIYGDEAHDLDVSPQTFVGFHEAWSIRQAYNQLWRKYYHRVLPTDINQDSLMALVGSYDLILSTIPANLLCYQNHQFRSVKVWIDSNWHGADPHLNVERYGAANVVICNGFGFDPESPLQTGWYRTSTIYGQANTEWTSESVNVFSPMGARPVVKPIDTNCNCWPGIIRAGRYGCWQKGVLSHEAFEIATEVFA
jgi:hypothetical protein